jgi:threonine synthase
VKACFNDLDFRHKHRLAAVNSINWCRIMAQIVYYFYSYFRVNEGKKTFRIYLSNYCF